jgi:hypothetical protein
MKRMELNGALSNPFQRDKSLLPNVSNLYHRALSRPKTSSNTPNTAKRDHTLALRSAITEVLAEAGSDLRLSEIHKRVEKQLATTVSRTRFKDYVNDQSRGTHPLLERLGYGRYRLRSESSPG